MVSADGLKCFDGTPDEVDGRTKRGARGVPERLGGGRSVGGADAVAVCLAAITAEAAPDEEGTADVEGEASQTALFSRAPDAVDGRLEDLINRAGW